jgi:hypothetical protein
LEKELGPTGGPAKTPEEIDYSGYDRDRLLHFLKLRDRQAKMSRKAWVRAAKEAMNGDWRSLMNRVELAEMGPVTITNGDDEWHVPGATE